MNAPKYRVHFGGGCSKFHQLQEVLFVELEIITVKFLINGFIIVEFECVASLLRTWKVPGFSLHSKSGYREYGFSWYSPVPRHKFHKSQKLKKKMLNGSLAATAWRVLRLLMEEIAS
jgi:hypothetical protein